MVTGKEIHTQRNRFFMAFLEKSRKECVKMGLAHEKKSYLQEKANLFEIGSYKKIFFCHFPLDNMEKIHYNTEVNGVWRSLVSRLVRVQEASGSNPDTPTKNCGCSCSRSFFMEALL